MAAASKADIIRAIFAAYHGRTIAKVVEDALTDDFRFTSPYDDSIDKATYFERCWKQQRLDRAARTRKRSSSRAMRPS